MTDEMNFANEFPEEAVEVVETSTELPEAVTEAADSGKTYTMNDGSQGSRAAFIREKFLVDNMSRKEIAEMYGFQYRVVYSATVNMTNGAEATTRGRQVVNATIKVTPKGEYVTEKDGKVLLNGQDSGVDTIDELGELEEVNRNEWIKEQVAAGMSRGDVAKILDMSYGVVYGITKDMEGSRARVEITLPDGTKVSRAEYIRMQYAAGVSRGDIAKELDVPYSVVWQATKTDKTDADHFAETVANLKAFADKVVDAEMFAEILAALDKMEIKQTEETEADATVETAEAAE